MGVTNTLGNETLGEILWSVDTIQFNATIGFGSIL
jgi:hypothetical protein